ncbi:flagellar protein [Anaerobacillus sp. CMMVII]|uniref:TIGR02530 family flagellar biosynthesis protein n=1 Tax=Anaerobacillus sp. CMMVII TaxID=2755588 RepID=UPI0021B7CB30|nr:TIGR02530 family flagellar biosynthesis protein [Anaerobacillus sp. CMMVII]MCT8139826.1 flagellar protein [Anaerobacillus sp. CMMVII]
MDKRIQAYNLNLLPRPTVQTKKPQGITSFKELLNSEIQDKLDLKVSKHAEKRLHDRGITIDDNKWAQISMKIQEAKQKGVKDSLVVLKNATLVVSAKNNTVITALDREEASMQIFTNINGTIIIE